MMRVLLPLLLALGCNPGGLQPVDPVDSDEPIDGALLGILITPESPIVSVGQALQLTATGLMEDRSSRDLTAVVTWRVDDDHIAIVSDGLDEEGALNALSVGSTTVWAELDGLESVPVTVKVTDAQLMGLTIGPSELDLSVGDSVQLTAQAVFSDGSRADGVGLVRWITGDGDVAQIASGGRLSAAAVGSTEIHAEAQGVSSNVVPVEVKAAQPSAKPDLTVQGVSAEAGGGVITATVTVGNPGTAGAGDFFVDAFLDPSVPPVVGDYGDDYSLVDWVSAGGTKQLSFSFPAEPGSHTLYVLVDSDASVTESNESNNRSEDTITVVDESTGPNLTVTYFDWLADETSLYYAVDVYNSGTEAVAAFYVDVYVDQTSAPVVPSDGDDFVEVTSLAAGDTAFADFLLETWCASCRSWVLVDSYDDIEETDESDNVAGPLTVVSP